MPAVITLSPLSLIACGVLLILAALLLALWCSQRRRLARLSGAVAYVAGAVEEGILELDREGYVTNCNAGAIALLGADAIRPRWDVRTLGDDPALAAVIDGALQGEEGSLKLKIGKIPCRLVAHPMPGGAMVLLFNISEKEGGEKMRREFTANVSHELKTPLTSISGFAEIIKDGIAKEGDVQHFADNIYNESQRLIHLVEDIIKLSRLDENTAPVERETVDMAQLVENTLYHLQALAEKKQVTFYTRIQPVCVYGAPYILDEIVFNLCENAVKYNRPDGTVTVTLTTENGKPVFRVEDTGIGIPPADRERVFERFYRVDKSHSRAIGGTGLGLSIVKHGVLFHEGTIQLESEPGVGTTITVTFPDVKN